MLDNPAVFMQMEPTNDAMCVVLDYFGRFLKNLIIEKQ